MSRETQHSARGAALRALPRSPRPATRSNVVSAAGGAHATRRATNTTCMTSTYPNPGRHQCRNAAVLIMASVPPSFYLSLRERLGARSAPGEGLAANPMVCACRAPSPAASRRPLPEGEVKWRRDVRCRAVMPRSRTTNAVVPVVVEHLVMWPNRQVEQQAMTIRHRAPRGFHLGLVLPRGDHAKRSATDGARQFIQPPQHVHRLTGRLRRAPRPFRRTSGRSNRYRASASARSKSLLRWPQNDSR